MMALAAERVSWMCRNAISWLLLIWKILDTVTTSRDVSKTLQNASIITIVLPQYVPGERSPYPIVEKVIAVNQIDSKYESNLGSPIYLK